MNEAKNISQTALEIDREVYAERIERIRDAKRRDMGGSMLMWEMLRLYCSRHTLNTDTIGVFPKGEGVELLDRRTGQIRTYPHRLNAAVALLKGALPRIF